MMNKSDFLNEQLNLLVDEYLELLEQSAKMEKRSKEKRRRAAEYRFEAEELKIRANQTRRIINKLGHSSISIVTTIQVKNIEKKAGGNDGK